MILIDFNHTEYLMIKLTVRWMTGSLSMAALNAWTNFPKHALSKCYLMDLNRDHLHSKKAISSASRTAPLQFSLSRSCRISPQLHSTSTCCVFSRTKWFPCKTSSWRGLEIKSKKTHSLVGSIRLLSPCMHFYLNRTLSCSMSCLHIIWSSLEVKKENSKHS